MHHMPTGLNADKEKVMKNTFKLLSIVMVFCMLLSSCAQVGVGIANTITNNVEENENVNNVVPNTGNTNNHTGSLSASNTNGTAPEKGTYNEGVVLVKYDGEFTENVLEQLDFKSTEPLYAGSAWYTVTLGDSMDTVEAVDYLTKLGCFEKVDYDYIMGVTADVESVDVSGNPDYYKQDNHGFHKVSEGWEFMQSEGKNPGGSPDVIVAVIDTGVDYNHLDLRNNIWVNPAEIPDNGIDDDKNGYIDDIYGWDCVGDDNDPIDDNGHGTHVAGIIAAENNDIGGVGVAYNCKIMVLKAGNSSGYFNNSDIAEAIQYAYMNGASVINMSFGGTRLSIAVEEALVSAYTSCILVAAAGNNNLCNDLECKTQCMEKAVIYPAAFTYVIGVMSVDKNGRPSSFTNYDHNPHNDVEYEVRALGEAVYSCWPGNKYTVLSGTSMAAPTVAGIAALLRSMYSDRELYATKYILSQIINIDDSPFPIVDAYEALSKIPTPEVNLYDYYIDDATSISTNNNGNGIIDAGETVHLYVSLQNRGGVATDINLTIDTFRNGDASLTDPYFTLVNTSIYVSDIGTYSVRNVTEYFEIIVDSNCPNEYLTNFNIRFTYKNGLNEDDETVYEDDGEQTAMLGVSNGYHLAGVISKDTVFTADKLYIISGDVVIPEDVTVTFAEGCQIQFYAEKEYYSDLSISVYGNLNFNGSKTRNIEIIRNSHVNRSWYYIEVMETGSIFMNYTQTYECYCTAYYYTSRANFVNSSFYMCNVDIGGGGTIDSCYLDISSFNTMSACEIINSYISMEKQGGYLRVCKSFKNNYVVTYGNISRWESSMGFDNHAAREIEQISNNYFNVVFKPLQSTISYVPRIGITYGESSVIEKNMFSSFYKEHASDIISNYYDASGNPTIDIFDSLANVSLLWPHVLNVEMFDSEGNSITTVGNEEIKVRVTFNRPMDKNAGTFLTFGTIEPYGDYRIDGEYISDTVWEGTYTLKTQIENGQNFIKVNNACAAEDQTKKVFGTYSLHEFTIDTTAAMSMNLLATPTDNGIELAFAQDDYDTLLGYNIYRADSKDGNYVKLNPAILLPSENTFLDENAEPGKTYWYTYTVVLTDFTESNPAGKVQVTAMDTLAPNMYHTPINQGYMNNNLVISCTASDNVGIQSVVLYYRTVGSIEWKTLTMVKQNDKYSATIFGSDLTLAGMEYYIVAYDEHNSIAKGSAETPYTIVIKDASAISRKGDVDGDGVVTTKDALMLMQCINGDLILSDDEFKRADLNGDNVLNSSEALRILQYINGKVNTLTM